MKDSTAAVIKDAYNSLKGLVTRKDADTPGGEIAVEQYPGLPDTWRAPLNKALTVSGAAADEQILVLARQVLEGLDPTGARVGKYVVAVRTPRVWSSALGTM